MTETTPMQPALDAPAGISAAPPAANLTQKLTAEAIGTAILVFLGCGAAVATGGDVAPTGLAFGIAIVVLVYSFGRISGGHFNPAVSVGAALAGRISWRETGTYVGAQIVGGLVGGLGLAIVALSLHNGGTHWKFGNPLGNNGFGDEYPSPDASVHVHWWGALLVEIVLTAIFLLVILATTDKRNEHPGLAPLAIGLALAAIHFVGINITGTSVNPARSIAVAFFSGSDAIKDLWLFIVAPLAGGALAGFAYPALFGHGEDPVPGSGLNFAGRPAASPAWGAPDQLQQQWNQQDQGQQGWQQPGAQPSGQQGWQQPASQPAEQQGWGQHTQQSAPAGDAHAEGPAEQTQIKSGQSWQQPAAPAAEGELPVYEQDGWRWDYGKQQWVPIEGSDQG